MLLQMQGNLNIVYLFYKKLFLSKEVKKLYLSFFKVKNKKGHEFQHFFANIFLTHLTKKIYKYNLFLLFFYWQTVSVFKVICMTMKHCLQKKLNNSNNLKTLLTKKNTYQKIFFSQSTRSKDNRNNQAR